VELYLDNNQLTAVPPEIGQLANLNLFTLQGNPLAALPPEIGHLTKLELFRLDEMIVPPELVAQGTKAILAYFREQRQDNDKRWVSKLLVVGEAGVGKTATLHSLRGETFEESLETTYGIDIRPLELRHPALSDVFMQLNTWDFGGQTIYHATHQFFMTSRSLFLLVWNARYGFEQCKLYYWLDIIKARAPESPVLIVATHTDEGTARLPLAELRQKYPQIIQHCEISNKTGDGIEALRREITDASAKLPLMGETWPTNWLNAAKTIHSRSEHSITAREFRELITQHSMTHDEVRVLAQWLHELGDILYFQDDEELNDIVILNPAWVTKAISRVLTSKEVIANKGVLTHAHMEILWQDINSAMRAHFLRLMERFDLSYRTLEGKKEVSLVVELLPLDPPNDYETTWNEIKTRSDCKEISMKFELGATMPPGIPTWFIARSYRFTTHTHWCYGALLADGPKKHHLGLIQAFPHDRYLRLTVRGPQPHNFFTLLRDGLEVTLERFPGLTVNRRIPCPGHDGQPCSYEFRYEVLQRAIEQQPPRKEVQCQDALKDVLVPELLFGLHWRTQDDVLEAIERLETANVGRHAELATQQAEMLALMQRGFTNVFRREQRFPESHCPNVFVLRPIGRTDGWKTLFGESMELQLYCQAPGCWHPTKEGGRYTIDKPAKWLIVICLIAYNYFTVAYFCERSRR
jgi:GTPase SAR1 family protein